MTERVPGLGELTDVPKPVENASYEGLDMGPEDWFILSRIDGHVTLRDIANLSPRPKDETWSILIKLHGAGIIALPNAEPAPATEVVAKASGPKTLLPPIPEGWPTDWATFEFDADAMAEDVPLDDDFKRAVLYYHAHRELVSYYELFGATIDAAPRDLRRRYFALSKAFHPDRFFRVELGSFRARLNDVFRWINEANRVLSNKRRRTQYDETLDRGDKGTWGRASTHAHMARPRPDEAGEAFVPQRRLDELLRESRQAERNGEFRAAFDLYEAALRQRHSPELLNRAAECLARLREDLDVAENRARGAVSAAPDNARYWVTLAFVLELQEHSDGAAKAYERALELDPNHEAARSRLTRLRGDRE